MGKDSLDQYFKDQLYHHKTPTDPEMIWNNIQNQRGGKSPGRSIIYWLIPLFFVIVIIAGAILVQKRTADTNTTAITSSTIKTENYNQSIEETTKNTIPSNQSSVQSVPSEITDDNIANSNSNQDFTLSESYLKEEKKINTYSRTSVTIPGSEKLGGTVSSNEIQESQTEGTIHKSDVTGIDDDSQSIGESELPGARALQSSEWTLEPEKVQEPVGASIRPIQSQALGLSVLMSGILYTSEFPTPLLEQNNFMKFYKARSYWNFSIGAYGLYGLTDKKINPTTLESENYFSERRRTESSLEATGFGLDLRASKWNNFYLKGGISYTQINERFEVMESRDSTYIDENQVVKIVINSNGDSIPEFGPALVTETFFYQKRIHNNYQFIDFPVSLGFQYDAGPLIYFIEAGASMNLLFSQKGEIFSESLTPYDLGSDSEGFFKSNAGLSFIGGFGLEYRITDYFSISAQSSIKYHLSGINAARNPVEQKYVVLGLQGGLRFHLNP